MEFLKQALEMMLLAISDMHFMIFDILFVNI